MNNRFTVALVSLGFCGTLFAESISTPKDPYFQGLPLLVAPRSRGLELLANDRLAICGDSITEQRMYSRIIETYLTVAMPGLHIKTRQYGWSGEQASGFLHRMTNDVLRFYPTIATTCYGMNDQHYRPYEPSIGEAYGSNMTDIVLAFESVGARVVVGAPGCMGMSNPPWNFVTGTPKERNINLCLLRDIDIGIAEDLREPFADVFWNMYLAQYKAVHRYGTSYTLAGKDSVHPGWAGHLVMAYSFLKGLGVRGEIGTYTVDLSNNRASVSEGHQLQSFHGSVLTVRSSRYPFCATGDLDKPDSIRSGMALVPFNEDLNRLTLIVRGAKAKKYRVTWEIESHDYTAEQLRKGINLAADFAVNPFSARFKEVDEAVAAKQEFETKQIKDLFHGNEGKENMDKTVADTEKDRAPLVTAIEKAFVPISHEITITPL